MGIFAKPRTLTESYRLVILLLRLAGLFPFHYDQVQQKFHVTWKGLAYSITHILIYTYVNVSSILESWRDFSQPMLGHSPFTALGNLVLRLLGIFITFTIMLPLLVGSAEYASSLNKYMQLMEEFTLLGIDVTCIYLRIYYMTWIATLILSGFLIFTAWHSIYFYEVITHKPPELKFYLVATLSTFYKNMFLFYGFMQLFGIYMASMQLNKFLAELRDRYRALYDKERMSKYGWPAKAENIKVF